MFVFAWLFIAFMVSGSSGGTQEGIGRIIAKLDTANLHLSYSVGEGGGNFAVLDSDVVVLAEGKELLILRDSKLQKKVNWRCVIDCLCLDRQGNGAIVCDNVVFRVRKMRIDSAGVVVNRFWTHGGGSICQIYFDDDSTVTIVPNARMVMVANINRLGDNQYTVLTDSLSQYIAEYAGSYLGPVGREHFFCNFSGEDGGVRLWSLDVQDGRLDTARIMDLGYLGDIDFMWGTRPYDKTRGLFYVATLQDSCLVIREFNIRDFVPGK